MAYNFGVRSLVDIMGGATYGWTGLFDGSADDYYEESCTDDIGEEYYGIDITTGAWGDPIETRSAGMTWPAGTAMRPGMDLFTGDADDVVEAWANVVLSGAQFTVTTHELAFHATPQAGWSSLYGFVDGVLETRAVSQVTTGFLMDLALLAYYSNGDGTYREVLVHSEGVGGTFEGDGTFKVNVTGMVKQYMTIRNEASFFRWFALPPGSAPVDPMTDTPCESLRQAWESVNPVAELTGYEHATEINALTGNPFYINEGEYIDYGWRWDSIGVSTISIRTNGGEITFDELLQNTIIPVEALEA